MQVTLRIDGKDKTFVQDFISGRKFRKTIVMQKLFGAGENGQLNIDESFVDTLVAYVVDMFDNQFTVDEFYDGIESHKILSTITGCINSVVNPAVESVGDSDPN